MFFSLLVFIVLAINTNKCFKSLFIHLKTRIIGPLHVNMKNIFLQISYVWCISFPCSITNYHKPRGLKQQLFVISQLLWVSPGLTELGSLYREGLMVLQSSCYWAVFQIGSSSREDYFRCWQNSFSCSCRTEVLFSCRLLTRSHSWVLELNSHLSPCGSLIIWQFPSSKPTKESLSLSNMLRWSLTEII